MRRPFHAFCNRAESAAEFLATPWMTRARDELDQLLLSGPGVLWRLKVHSYLDQAARRPNVTVLRHEDLLQRTRNLGRIAMSKLVHSNGNGFIRRRLIDQCNELVKDRNG